MANDDYRTSGCGRHRRRRRAADGKAAAATASGYAAREHVTVRAAGDAERRYEDLHQHDEVQEIGRHVLPEGDLSERQPFLPIFVVFLDAERVLLLRLS